MPPIVINDLVNDIANKIKPQIEKADQENQGYIPFLLNWKDNPTQQKLTVLAMIKAGANVTGILYAVKVLNIK